MENKLFLQGAVVCLICVTFLSSATDSQNIHAGKSFSHPDRQEMSPILLIASVIGHSDYIQTSGMRREEDTELKTTEGIDSVGRNKRSVISVLKSIYRVNKAMQFLKKDGVLVSNAGSRHLVWIKPGGAKRADSDYFKVKPAGVTFTATDGVKTATGNFEGGKLVLKEDLYTHACEIVFSKVLRDGRIFSCTFKYLD